MKPHHKILLTSFLLMVFVINAHCQTKMTEGRIEYSVTYPDSIDINSIDSFLPKQMVIWIKGEKLRDDVTLPGNIIYSSIYDNKTNNEITLAKVLGHNMATISKWGLNRTGNRFSRFPVWFQL